MNRQLSSALFEDEDVVIELHEVQVQKLGPVPVAKGDFHRLPKKVQRFLGKWIQVCKPRALYICDGTQSEADEVIHKLMERGTLHKLTHPGFKNCYVCRTDPADVARVESKTWMCTKDKYQSVPHTMPGVQGILGKWCSEEEAAKQLDNYNGCMTGRMMYVIPFSMGPIGSPLSKIGIEITDSNYVLLCMRIMARVSHDVWEVLGDGDFVRCVHSMGSPRPAQRKTINHWPCNPDKVFIGHFPDRREICSFGSGYGGNSLLGKKCFALRIASNIARDEGWLAEHMLIMGIQKEGEDKEVFIAAAFPSACGKTNMAMLTPLLKGYKVRCIGDDIAWMRFDENGQLYGINPEAGFFGVCPGTNYTTNPNAMYTCEANTIFTNVAETIDGKPFWEGLEREHEDDNPNTSPYGTALTSWLNEQMVVGQPGKKAAHPNSRFCCPAGQCPIIHPKWEDKKGVPISAFIFGGRRPKGVPLIYESFNWEHGVMVGACVKSEATAAAEFTGKKIMHDPMAMRPFMGYNFGKYLQHWLDLNKKPNKMPKIFHVNWFRTDEDGEFLWPGFGQNIRVIDWILRRCANEPNIAVESPIGYLPKKGSINCEGLGEIKWEELMSLPKHYWEEEIVESIRFLTQQCGEDLPKELLEQLKAQQERIDEKLFA
jgi:phosphoenolpyruvate carboxykinase (GTP)